jgi:DNA polymerase-3 subunit chi
MTEVSFHFNVSDTLGYACRLLRKATRQGARVTVTGDTSMLAGLDRVLWSFDPIEFVPHLLVRHGAPVAERLRATPVCLTEDLSGALHHDVLVNLGSEAPRGFESFARVIEIVSSDEQERTAARLRWKHYAARGYPIERHEVVA